jgi:hypothetical protein
MNASCAPKPLNIASLSCQRRPTNSRIPPLHHKQTHALPFGFPSQSTASTSQVTHSLTCGAGWLLPELLRGGGEHGGVLVRDDGGDLVHLAVDLIEHNS